MFPIFTNIQLPMYYNLYISYEWGIPRQLDQDLLMISILFMKVHVEKYT